MFFEDCLSLATICKTAKECPTSPHPPSKKDKSPKFASTFFVTLSFPKKETRHISLVYSKSLYKSAIPPNPPPKEKNQVQASYSFPAFVGGFNVLLPSTAIAAPPPALATRRSSGRAASPSPPVTANVGTARLPPGKHKDGGVLHGEGLVGKQVGNMQVCRYVGVY